MSLMIFTMRIAAFTDHLSTPSSRFRIRQYFPALKTAGIHAHDYCRKYSTQTAAPIDGRTRIRESLPLMAKAALHESINVFSRFYQSLSSNRYDAVWLSRQLIIGSPTFESFIRRPLIYDIDDAIFLSGKLSHYQFRKVAEKACAVIAGNDYLADEAAKHNRSVYVIPTAVDIRRWRPSSAAITEAFVPPVEFKVGWSGTSSSFPFFLPIQREIIKFLRDCPSAKLAFMADRFPHELDELKPYIEFVQWSVDDEVSFVQSLTVGLMPVRDDLWSRGKCAYKLLLYAACGVPVIATPIGANMKILAEADIGIGANHEAEWYKALRLLFEDRQVGRELGLNGIKLVTDRYSVDVCAPKIIDIFARSL